MGLLYREYRDELYGFLRARLPEDDAADAFQETFLRALRTYPGLRHGHELRGWLYTIARSVLADRGRRAASRPQQAGARDVQISEAAAHTDGGRAETDPAALVTDVAGLAALTGELPSKERAAVILRYGFDLGYDEIGSALEASADAARQATSSGVRRLRHKLTTAGQENAERKDEQ